MLLLLYDRVMLFGTMQLRRGFLHYICTIWLRYTDDTFAGSCSDDDSFDRTFVLGDNVIVGEDVKVVSG